MIVIADSGSTKTNWCFLQKDKVQLLKDTEGFNPYYVNTEQIKNSLELHFTDADLNNSVTEIHFYGSGCFPEMVPVVSNALTKIFKNASVSIELDLLAAARALLKSEPGFAAILGTGTNSCLYDGEKIIQNIDSLGFILGDEGSATSIGKRLLADYIRGYMPADMENLFSKEYQLTKDQIFRKVYGTQHANRFCGGLSLFVHKYIEYTYMSELVESCFRLFFSNLVSQYKNYQQHSFNCIGSIGFVFADQLKKVAMDFNMLPGTIVRSPLEGLISYHTKP